MAKRNFILTKKALSSYLGISRNTLRKRLTEGHIDIMNIQDILDWLIFEGMGIGRLENYLHQYLIRHRGDKCEKCGKTVNLQFHHKSPRGDDPRQIYIAKNIEILCRECHSLTVNTLWQKMGIKNNPIVRNPSLKL